MLRGHYAYYGIAGNIRALRKVHRAVESYWRKMLSSRSWKGEIWWKQFQQIKARFPSSDPNCICPMGRCSLSLRCEATSDERSAGNPHATFCGSRGWATAPGHPVVVSDHDPYSDRQLRCFLDAPGQALGFRRYNFALTRLRVDSHRFSRSFPTSLRLNGSLSF